MYTLFPNIHVPFSSFEQPPRASLHFFAERVNSWPYVEIAVRDIGIVLPVQSSNPSGLLFLVQNGVMFTHKPEDASVPLGSMTITGKSKRELLASATPVPTIYYYQRNLFSWVPHEDDTPIFPRFILSLWNVDLYSTESDHPISSGLYMNVTIRPKVDLPSALFEMTQNLAAERLSLYYHPRFRKEQLPNSLGLPLDIALEIDPFYLSLLQSEYNLFLLFFFLNLGETPTICNHPTVPQCKQCSYFHDPLLSCDDCWCVFRLTFNQTVLYPSFMNGNALVLISLFYILFYSIPELFLFYFIEANWSTANGLSQSHLLYAQQSYPIIFIDANCLCSRFIIAYHLSSLWR